MEEYVLCYIKCIKSVIIMESTGPEARDPKKKSRPAQRLYVPPAQRNKHKTSNTSPTANSNILNIESIENITVESEMNPISSCTCVEKREIDSTNNDEQSLLIMLGNIKTDDSGKNVDRDKEEMERAIVNINRKTRPLIKHVNVGNKDVLHIHIDDKDVKHKSKPKKVKDAIQYEHVSNWEDLFNEDDQVNGGIAEQIGDISISRVNRDQEGSSEDEECSKKNIKPDDLDHIVELYDFPSSLKTQDLIQLYSQINNDSMYIKWCDETHALLVLSTPNQAKRALHIQHSIIKSRAMINASDIANQVASRSDLKPAMKRPQTNMQTARRLITSHLGTKSKLSKEEHAKEREELRKAKELKRALKQSENDAWDGFPRPSTA